jgi:hypothetical protein
MHKTYFAKNKPKDANENDLWFKSVTDKFVELLRFENGKWNKKIPQN